LATGLLLLVLGEALPHQNRFTAEKKTYSGVIRLGFSTDTDDLQGKPLDSPRPRRPEDIAEKIVREALAAFSGPQDQEVPLFSAAKVKGKPLYHWARRGIPVDRPKKPVEVHWLEFLGYAPPDLRFRLTCSKGFYVRALARDLGEKLGTGGTLASLCRESIGEYTRANAYPWVDRSELNPALFEKAFVPIEKCDP
jgi:tRNA pseudouridine55 synthase